MMSCSTETGFAFLWEDREAVQTDVEVQVEAESGPASRRTGLRSGSASKSLRLHKIVIAARSPYFKAQITSWSKTRKQAATLRLAVPADEVAVSDAVFYFMYHECLPADPAPEPLACVSIARLADRLGMDRCVDAALALLKQVPVEQLADARLLNALLSLNQLQCQIVSRPSWTAGVLPRCRGQLLEAFGTPSTVLSTPALLQRFCELDFDAVLEWAWQDKLCVDSENDVVAALHAWLALHPAVKSNAALFDQLRRAVRPLHATSFFLCGPMAEMGWMDPIDAMQLAQTKLDASVHNKVCFIGRVFGSGSDKTKWYTAAARTGAAPHRDGSFTFVTKVPRAHIEASFEGAEQGSRHSSEPVYFQGCFWLFRVNWRKRGSTGSWNLGVYFFCKPLDASLSLDPVRSAFAHGRKLSFSRSRDKATGAPRAAHTVTNRAANASGTFFDDPLHLDADQVPHEQRLQKVLDDFIVDGHLLITTTLSGLKK